MQLLTLSSASEALTFLLIDSADHISSKTGVNPSVLLSKNGGAFHSPSGAVSEIGNGWYKVAGHIVDTDTLGPLIMHVTAPGTDPQDVEKQVIYPNLHAALATPIQGSGARTVTVTVTSSSVAIPGARVRMTAGVTTFVLDSDINGQAVFSLDDNTYTLSISKSGYTYAPTTQTITGTTAIAASMTAVVITSPTDPTQSTAYLTTYDGQGAVQGFVEVTFKMTVIPSNDTGGRSFADDGFTVQSDVNGLLNVSLARLATYKAKREDGNFHTFTVTDTSTFELPSGLGHPAS